MEGGNRSLSPRLRHCSATTEICFGNGFVEYPYVVIKITGFFFLLRIFFFFFCAISYSELSQVYEHEFTSFVARKRLFSASCNCTLAVNLNVLVCSILTGRSDVLIQIIKLIITLYSKDQFIRIVIDNAYVVDSSENPKIIFYVYERYIQDIFCLSILNEFQSISCFTSCDKC